MGFPILVRCHLYIESGLCTNPQQQAMCSWVIFKCHGGEDQWRFIMPQCDKELFTDIFTSLFWHVNTYIIILYRQVLPLSFHEHMHLYSARQKINSSPDAGGIQQVRFIIWFDTLGLSCTHLSICNISLSVPCPIQPLINKHKTILIMI